MNYIVNSKQYFENLNRKDLDLLSLQYAPNIELYDWNDVWYGSTNVLGMNAQMFEDNLKFELKECVQFENRTYNEILIHTESETILVMDVLYFNKETGKIEKIKAYKG